MTSLCTYKKKMDFTPLRHTLSRMYAFGHRVDLTTGAIYSSELAYERADSPPARWVAPQELAFADLLWARHTGSELAELQMIGEDVGGSDNDAKRYTLCKWDVMYKELCARASSERHFYAIVLDRLNVFGVPLLLDIDYNPERHGPTPPTRAEFMQGVWRIRDAIIQWARAEAGLTLTLDDFLVYDGCVPGKPSVHMLCRRIGFFSAEEGRAFAERLRRDVYPLVDATIPKNKGLYKLPGNTKRVVGKRGQRPNHHLDEHLPPLQGTEDYREILSLAEFRMQRPYLEPGEAVYWPEKTKQPLGPSLRLRGLSTIYAHLQHYTQLNNALLWSCALSFGATSSPPSIQLLYWNMIDETIATLPFQSFGTIAELQHEFLVKNLAIHPGYAPLSLRVVPDRARFLVFDVDLRDHPVYKRTCELQHDRYQTCARCWSLLVDVVSKMRARVEREQALPAPVIFDTGSNGVHLWYALDTLELQIEFARVEVRTALFDKYEELGAFDREVTLGAGRTLHRLPGTLHDVTSRPYVPLRLPLTRAPWPPAHLSPQDALIAVRDLCSHEAQF